MKVTTASAESATPADVAVRPFSSTTMTMRYRTTVSAPEMPAVVKDDPLEISVGSVGNVHLHSGSIVEQPNGYQWTSGMGFPD